AKRRVVCEEPEVPEELPTEAFSLAAAVREMGLILNDLSNLIRDAQKRKDEGRSSKHKMIPVVL
ncbi:MAG: hypothetical protein CMM03_02160, partial [Rhodopirellula sp.]|nr:hypothetical protein [Rhodopirellula sp.]